MSAMGKIFAMIFDALLSGTRLAGRMAAVPIEGVAALVAGLFRRRPAESEETVDQPDAIGEAALQRVLDRERDRDRELAKRQRAYDEKVRPTPAMVLRLAAQARDERRPIDDRLFDKVSDGRKLRHYAAGLSRDHWRSVLHMTSDALDRHLSAADVPGLPSYVRYDWSAGGKRAKASEEARLTAGWSASQLYRDMLEAAISRGEDTVDQRALWQRAHRKANG